MKKIHRGTTRAALLVCAVVLCLISLRAVPSFSLWGYEVKRVDLLADLLSQGKNGLQADSAAAGSRARAVLTDTCPVGITCIEDYAIADASLGMQPLYEALAARHELGRPVRIAYFGDSFIEGDILTADLRALLQQHFGGSGVGLVDIASPFTELRNSVKHKNSGWKEHNVLEKKGCDTTLLGITGRYALGGVGASVSYEGVKDYAHLDTFEVATLYAAPSSSARIAMTVNGQSVGELSLSSQGAVRSAQYEGRIGSVRFDVVSGQLAAYGVALESRSGIVVDNFSLRGSSGTPLATIPTAHLSALYAVRPYDLVVLQFGLNVANKKQTNYDNYAKRMKAVVQQFKAVFPDAGILIVSIGDREDRENGTLRTMPAVKALIDSQQTMAAEAGVAFWNLYEAMGGEGAIRRMAEATPPEAGKDYTHINRRGGKRVATAMYRAIVHGYECFIKNNR